MEDFNQGWGFGEDADISTEEVTEETTEETSETTEAEEGLEASETEETQNHEDGQGDQGDEGESKDGDTADNAEGKPTEEKTEPETPQMLHVKYMDEEKDISLNEAKTLAQKGMDYDRVRTKYDESKPIVEVITNLARKSNMTVADFTARLRLEAKKAEGFSEEDAARELSYEDRETAINQRESKVSAKNDAQVKQDKVRNEIQNFVTEHPDVKANEIPQEVWNEVKAGKSLSSAYLKWENGQLAAKVKALETNKANTGKGTGSMKSAGKETQKDPFSQGWDFSD